MKLSPQEIAVCRAAGISEAEFINTSNSMHKDYWNSEIAILRAARPKKQEEIEREVCKKMGLDYGVFRAANASGRT